MLKCFVRRPPCTKFHQNQTSSVGIARVNRFVPQRKLCVQLRRFAPSLGEPFVRIPAFCILSKWDENVEDMGKSLFYTL
jgi:hypothetical protein